MTFPEISDEMKDFIALKLQEAQQREQRQNKIYQEQQDTMKVEEQQRQPKEIASSKILEQLESLYDGKDEINMICPICHVKLPLGEEELHILKEQGYIFCPHCREKVSVHEILEPSYNSLILEHRKILKNVEKDKNTNSSDQSIQQSNNQTYSYSNGR